MQQREPKRLSAFCSFLISRLPRPEDIIIYALRIEAGTSSASLQSWDRSTNVINVAIGKQRYSCSIIISKLSTKGSYVASVSCIKNRYRVLILKYPDLTMKNFLRAVDFVIMQCLSTLWRPEVLKTQQQHKPFTISKFEINQTNKNDDGRDNEDKNESKEIFTYNALFWLWSSVGRFEFMPF